MAKNIRDAIKEYFPKRNEVDIIAEPGRYFATSAFSIATYIHGKRIIHDDDTGEPINVFLIPDGIFGSFNALLFDPVTFHPIPLSRVFTVQFGVTPHGTVLCRLRIRFVFF